jgi:hypothetical protein
LVPALADVIEQVPAETGHMLDAEPSVTVTLPTGVPPVEVTVYATEYACPTALGSGLIVPMVVAVIESIFVESLA